MSILTTPNYFYYDRTNIHEINEHLEKGEFKDHIIPFLEILFTSNHIYRRKIIEQLFYFFSKKSVNK